MTLRLLLVDDHAQYRASIRALLEGEPDLLVVAEASSGADAISIAPQCQPDLAMIEVGLSGMDGIEVVRRLCALTPSMKVLALSVHDDPALVRAAVAAGTMGYATKEEPLSDLLVAIRLVASGGCYYGPSAQRAIMPRRTECR